MSASRLTQQMLKALNAALPHLDNAESPGGCDGSQTYCDHCKAIRLVRKAIRSAESASAQSKEE